MAPPGGDIPDFAVRRRTVLGRAEVQGAAALLVTDRVNVAYLSGFTGSHGCLLLTPAGASLVTDGRYVDQAARQCPDVTVLVERCSEVAAVRLACADALAPVALEAEHITLQQYGELVDVAGQSHLMATRGLVEKQRRAKDPYEIGCITEACRLIDAALAHVLPAIVPGATEKQIANALDRAVVDLGADAVGFETIVAAGANSAIPHHSPTSVRLQPGDLLKIDAGARFRGYHSDMTRTFVVGAEPSMRQRDVFAAVAAAAAAARDTVGPGTPVAAADAAARGELGGLADRFTHGLGHGVGLQIHEAPMLSARSADTMDPTDVLTIEPGVYLPGFGGVRIEDTLLVTETGSRCLTTTPRDLIRLG